MPAAQEVEEAAQDVERTRTGRLIARAGIAARAFVYLVIGIVAMRVALGSSGAGGADTSESASATGAVKALAGLPGGRVLIAVLSLGLAGYVVFSVLDLCLHRRGRNREERAGTALISAGAAVVYAAFSIWTANLALHPGQQNRGNSQRGSEFSARVMRWPMGRELVGAAGVVVIGIAVGFAWSGISRRFLDHLPDDRPAGRARCRDCRLGVVGYLGRALAFAVTGSCLIAAAVRFDPDQAEGLDGSLRSLAGSAWGTVLLFAVAVGLVLFSAYLAVEVRYRKV